MPDDHWPEMRRSPPWMASSAPTAFDDLAGRDALAILTVAPTPEQGQALTVDQISQLLREAGRKHYLDATASKIHTALQAEHLRALPAVAQAFGTSTRALVSIISELVKQISMLASEVEQNFGRHPDAKIYLSQPGFGVILGARALAEFGDDPHRYVTGKARRNYARNFSRDPSFRLKNNRIGPLRPKPTAGRCTIPANLRRPDRLARRPPLLRRDARSPHRPS